MWQRFTERARRVVFFAQQEASQRGESHVGPEHLLLGLLREQDNVAARILRRMDIDPAEMRETIEQQLPRDEAKDPTEMQITPRARRVFDLSYDAARDLSNDYIGTEHLLLGLTREGHGIAAQVLHKAGATPAVTFAEVQALQTEESVSRLKAKDLTPTQAAAHDADVLITRISVLLRRLYEVEPRLGAVPAPEQLSMLAAGKLGDLPPTAEEGY